MKMLIATLATALMSHLCFAAEFKPDNPNPTSIRIIPVKPTPEGDNIENLIIYPKRGQTVYAPINLQFRLGGFPLGTDSDFERRKEIVNNEMGQALRIIIDDYPPFQIYRNYVNSLDNSQLYYNLLVDKTIPYQLNEGEHVLRAFPIRSYGEGIKGDRAFASEVFYVGRQMNNIDADFSAPYLTYNEPTDEVIYDRNKPILLDFYITNVQLSKDGYKVRLSIDDTIERVLTMWVPYYIYGLKPGRHKIVLNLVNEKNMIVPGIFNHNERVIEVR